MKIITSQVVERSPLNGLPLRPYITKSTPQPVMCGVMAVSFTRYGVSDINLLKVLGTWRYICLDTVKIDGYSYIRSSEK